MAVKTVKVDLPAEIFDAKVNVALIHQVVKHSPPLCDKFVELSVGILDETVFSECVLLSRDTVQVHGCRTAERGL